MGFVAAGDFETGFTRRKNAAHTMSMNFLVYALAIISFWAVGFGSSQSSAESRI